MVGDAVLREEAPRRVECEQSAAVSESEPFLQQHPRGPGGHQGTAAPGTAHEVNSKFTLTMKFTFTSYLQDSGCFLHVACKIQAFSCK